MIISVFDKLTNTKNPRYADVKAVFESIRTGGRLKPIYEQIRATKDKEERDELKKGLPVILFSGKFS